MEWSRKKFKTILLVPFLLVLLLSFLALSRTVEHAYGAGSEMGKKVYQKYCVICHGERGAGNGVLGIINRFARKGLVWSIYPRDFTVGTYKFRTTPTGCLPDDEDIMRIITDGIPRSGMPSLENVSIEERRAVKEYIKTFSPRWEEEDPCEVITVKKPDWIGTAESVIKGEKIYKDVKCWECHGMHGRGDGPKSGELRDDWGDRILPFDFTSGALKRGSSPENIYITFTTGLEGAVMPSYADSIKEDDRWHLVSYTLKLMGQVE
jgi:cytochrome c oxidase cbb3-type subunit 2